MNLGLIQITENLNLIGFKFQKEEFNLELLDKLARANDNIVNEAILRQCMINDTKKETDL